MAKKNSKIKKDNVAVESSAEQTTAPTRVEKSFYPDVSYNKSKRIKFFSLFALLLICMGIPAAAFITLGEWWIAMIILVVVLVVACFIPQTLRNYPVKSGVPQLEVSGREVKACGKTFHVQDIESARVIIELAPVSKIDSENKAFIKKFASKMPEDECFGTIELTFKPYTAGVKKGESIFCVVEDCLGALTALVDIGLKHYAIGFSMRKLYEAAQFSITKTEIKQQKLTDVSQKDRLKQIL